MGFTYEFPPDHDERMRVLEQSTASLGWGRDDTMMTMHQRKAVALMAMAQDVLAGKDASTRLLAAVDTTRDELRRLWANPHLPEIQQQLALLAPLYKRLNDRLNGQWPECRSESDAEHCKQLGIALRLRQRQLAERSPLQAQAV